MVPRQARIVAGLAVLVATFVGTSPAQSDVHRVARRTSTHWAGYVDTLAGAAFTAVQATWVQPPIRCDRPNSSAAFWIGLGGATASATGLEQIGTSADCSGDFTPSYSAWYELMPLPAAPVELPVTIAPGDTITAHIEASDATVALTIQNLTTGKSFLIRTTSFVLDLSSAEWIAEAPSVCIVRCTPLPLANFGLVTFQHATAVTGAHAGTIDDPAWISERTTLVTANRDPKGLPSALSTDGGSFSILWRETRPPRRRHRR
jgi:hypothetical protein